MSRFIPILIENIERAISLKTLMSYIVKLENNYISLFDIATEDIFDFYYEALKYFTLDNGKVSPYTIARVWRSIFEGNQHIEFLDELGYPYELDRLQNDIEFTRNMRNIDTYSIYQERLRLLHALDKYVEEFKEGREKYIELLFPWNYRKLHYLDIFNMMISSEDIPFIALNIDKSTFHKKVLSVDRKFKIFHNGVNMIDFIDETNIPKTIIMKIFNRIISRENKYHYSNLRYELVTQQFILEIQKSMGVSPDAIIQRFLSSIPLNFQQQIQSRVDGVFYATGITFNKFILLHLIYTDDILSNFIYLDESQKTLSEKKRFTLHIVTDQELDRKTTVTLSFDERTGSTKLELKKSKDKQELNYVTSLIVSILDIYQAKQEKIMKEYNQILGTNLKPEIIQENTKELRILEILREEAPDMFIAGYGQFCQAGKQPSIIPEDQIEEYEENGIEVVEYPEGSGLFFAGTIERPFIKLKPNTLENKEKFPFLPCTSKVKQISNSSYVRKRIIPLSPGTIGTLTPEIIGIFGDVKRVYTVQSKDRPLDTFFLAVQQALEIPRTSRQQLIQQMEEKGVLPVIAKQELYDLSPDQILDEIANPKKVFLSSRLYRILEQLYDINIFTFTVQGIEVPRHFKFHIRDWKPNNKKTILIFKHLSNQYEPIILNKSYIFGIEAERKCLNMLYGAIGVRQISIFGERELQSKIKNVVTKEVIEHIKPTHQYIDPEGHTRFLIGEQEYETIMQPLNLPLYVPKFLDLGLSEAKQFNLARRYAFVLKQVLVVLLSYWKDTRISFLKFIKEGKPNYTINLKEIYLPKFNNFDEAYNYFMTFIPSFKDAIYVDDVEGVRFFAKNLILPAKIPNMIMLYETSQDYNGNVFQDELELYKNLLYNNKKINEVQNNIIFSKSPYFYKIEDKLYLLQNVYEGELERCITVLDYWYKYKINPGFYAGKTSVEVTPNIVTELRQIKPYTVLLYRNSYIAILPIS